MLLLCGCSQKINAYNFKGIGLDEPELETGEKAVWFKRLPLSTFMSYISVIPNPEDLAKKEDKYPLELAEGKEENPSIKYKKEIYIFGADKKIRSENGEEILNLLYEPIFSSNEFLEQKLGEKIKTEQILCFVASEISYPKYRIFPTEYVVFYSTNKGDYVLLICGRYDYQPGAEFCYLVPWDIFMEALYQETETWSDAMGARNYEEYDKFFEEYEVEIAE